MYVFTIDVRVEVYKIVHELSGLKIAKQEQGPQLPCSSDTLGLSGVWLLDLWRILTLLRMGGGGKVRPKM